MLFVNNCATFLAINFFFRHTLHFHTLRNSFCFANLSLSNRISREVRNLARGPAARQNPALTRQTRKMARQKRRAKSGSKAADPAFCSRIFHLSPGRPGIFPFSKQGACLLYFAPFY